jgi:hypothetical protein
MRSMKRTLCATIFGLVLVPGYAQQNPHDRTDNSGQAGQTVSPASTPQPTTALSVPSTAPSAPSAATHDAVGINSALLTQIQEALNRDPILSRGAVKVTAASDGIELTGDVASGRERLNAERIAQSYARGRKVLNHIVVKGHGAPAGPDPPENPPANFNGSTGTPDSGNGNPPRS